jgi:hypothetical protein
MHGEQKIKNEVNLMGLNEIITIIKPITICQIQKSGNQLQVSAYALAIIKLRTHLN